MRIITVFHLIKSCLLTDLSNTGIIYAVQTSLCRAASGDDAVQIIVVTAKQASLSRGAVAVFTTTTLYLCNLCDCLTLAKLLQPQVQFCDCALEH